jgi:hypothetical protein
LYTSLVSSSGTKLGLNDPPSTTNVCKVTWDIYGIGFSYSGGSSSIPYARFKATYEGYTGGNWIKAKVAASCSKTSGGGTGYASGEFYVNNTSSNTANLSSISGTVTNCYVNSCEIYATGSSEGRGVGDNGTKVSTSCSGTINSTWGQWCGKTTYTYSYKD